MDEQFINNFVNIVKQYLINNGERKLSPIDVGEFEMDTSGYIIINKWDHPTIQKPTINELENLVFTQRINIKSHIDVISEDDKINIDNLSDGLLIFNLTNNSLELYINNQWKTLTI